jgi:hypothetical protein
MKKALLFGSLFLAVITANAQVTFKPGLRAGANLSKITNTDFDYKPGFYISAFGALKLTKFYTLQPEVGYSSQGTKGDLSFNRNGRDWTESADISLDYVTFSLINKFTLTDAINVHVGPTFDIGTNTKDNMDDDVDVGVTAGIGYTFPFGLAIEARVKKGFVDVIDDYYYTNEEGYSDYYDYNGDVNSNLVFQLGVTYSFDVTGSNK